MSGRSDRSRKPSRPVTVPSFTAAKREGRTLSMITAYDYPWARIADEAGVDSILVGDTLGMVVQGKPTTMPVTLEEIIYHAELVVRGSERALVVVDMPFMTFQVGPLQAVENGGRILKETGASAVKLEGGANQARTIEALDNADIPVMAHIGMRPQSVRKLGSMGRIQRDEKRAREDARAAEQAGAFAIVLELVPQALAAKITRDLAIPTIGIGAGPHCDGQVLVGHDMLGITQGFQPKFLKQYADIHGTAVSAIQDFVHEVRDGVFPGPEHSHD